MIAHGLDAYIVASYDAHSSEYIAPADERRAFLTGFGGSAGTALVTATQALLWTDSRYFLEAEARLKGTEWILMRQHQPGVLELREWVLEKLQGKTVGFDPALIPAEIGQDWATTWGSKVTPKGIEINLVDAIWLTRPEDPCNPVEVHQLEYAGEDVTDKIQRVRTAVKEARAEALILSALDQIAWLFNLRGSDIECNPVFFAYALITEDQSLLFLRALEEGCGGLTPEVQAHLNNASVKTHPYRGFFAEARKILHGKRVFLELSSCSVAIRDLVLPSLQVTGTSPVEKFKAIKNDKEIEGLRRACLRDSLALCELLAALEARLCGETGGGEPMDEVGAAKLMSELRRKQPLYVGDSFPTISSVGANSAVIHYQPQPGSCKVLERDLIYLIDTGAQFRDGTTDVTRTVHFGEPTAEQRRCYTRVLQGHVSLAMAVFPEGTPGLMLDTLARQPLWRDGLSYSHGTGHGIGAYLNVHEGPAGIGGGTVPGNVIMGNDRMKRAYLWPLLPGHFLSDEPGFYKDGEFGVRLESDLVVAPADTHFNFGSRAWLKFEYLTLVPFCQPLLDHALLTSEEIKWIDAYHGRIWDSLEASIDAGARDWLRKATRPLVASS